MCVPLNPERVEQEQDAGDHVDAPALCAPNAIAMPTTARPASSGPMSMPIAERDDEYASMNLRSSGFSVRAGRPAPKLPAGWRRGSGPARFGELAEVI